MFMDEIIEVSESMELPTQKTQITCIKFELSQRKLGKSFCNWLYNEQWAKFSKK